MSIYIIRNNLEKRLSDFPLLPLSNPKYLQYLASYLKLDVEFLMGCINGYYIFSPVFIKKSRYCGLSRFLRYGNNSPFGLAGSPLLLKDWVSSDGYLDFPILRSGLSALIAFLFRELGLKYVKLKVSTYPHRFSDDKLINLTPYGHNIHLLLNLSSADYLMEAKDISEYWKKIGKKSRNTIRKAERYGFKFRIGNQSDVDAFFSLWKDEIYKMHGIRVGVGPEFLLGLMNKMRDEALLTVIEDRSGEILGGAFSLIYKRAITFLMWSTKEEIQRLGSKNYLIWKTVEYALQNKGVRIIDYGESLRGSGSASFKMHMGGEEYTTVEIRAFKKPYHLFVHSPFRALIGF